MKPSKFIYKRVPWLPSRGEIRMCHFKTCWEGTEDSQEVAFQKQSTLTNTPRSRIAVLKGRSTLNSNAWLSNFQRLAQFLHCFCFMRICVDSDISPGMITSPALLGVPSFLPFSFLSFPLNFPISFSGGDSSLKGHLGLPHSLVNVQEHFLFKNTVDI